MFVILFVCFDIPIKSVQTVMFGLCQFVMWFVLRWSSWYIWHKILSHVSLKVDNVHFTLFCTFETLHICLVALLNGLNPARKSSSHRVTISSPRTRHTGLLYDWVPYTWHRPLTLTVFKTHSILLMKFHTYCKLVDCTCIFYLIQQHGKTLSSHPP